MDKPLPTISHIGASCPKTILIYNTMWNEPLDIPLDQVPADCVFTTNRNLLEVADMVVFHLPTLAQELENDLDKPDNQKWVAWSMECEENYPFQKDQEFMELFDYRMSYHQDADIISTYYQYSFQKDILQIPEMSFHRKKDICMLISSPFNQSKRQEYLWELMQHIKIDSYGRLFNNCKLEQDTGRDSKIELYKTYKFVIAFENSCARDYVTEKFFDPLLAGAVPVYLGAPNAEEFAPGKNSFISVPQFTSPKELADFLQACIEDEQLYNRFLKWKQQPLATSFLTKTEIQKVNPFIRLCQLISNTD